MPRLMRRGSTCHSHQSEWRRGIDTLGTQMKLSPSLLHNRLSHFCNVSFHFSLQQFLCGNCTKSLQVTSTRASMINLSILQLKPIAPTLVYFYARKCPRHQEECFKYSLSPPSPSNTHSHSPSLLLYSFSHTGTFIHLPKLNIGQMIHFVN